MFNLPRSVILTGLSLFAGADMGASAQENLVPAASIAGVETVPVDGDIVRYRAVLVETDEGGDLYIFTNGGGTGWTQAVHAPNLVWRGAMYGQEPWLELTDHGSLRVYSENSSVGRNRWEQVLTIAYRENRFVLAGFTYTYYDTLDPDANGKCDVNLLTGRGELNGKAIKSSVRAPNVGEWTMDSRVPECAVQ